MGNKTYIGHGGSVRGFRTHLRLDPEDKVAVIAFANADDGSPTDSVDRAFRWVAPAIARMVKPELARTPPDPNWNRYVGKYRSAWGDGQVLILNDDLVMIDPTQSDPTSGLTKLIPVAEHTFLIETNSGTASRGEQVEFEIDDTGTVVRVRVGQNYSYPLENW